MAREIKLTSIGDNSILTLEYDNVEYALSELKRTDHLLDMINRISKIPNIAESLYKIINNDFKFIKIYEYKEWRSFKFTDIFNKCEYIMNNNKPMLLFTLCDKNDAKYFHSVLDLVKFCECKFEFIDKELEIVDLDDYYHGKDNSINKLKMNKRFINVFRDGYNILSDSKNKEFYSDSNKLKPITKNDKVKEYIFISKIHDELSSRCCTIGDVYNKFDDIVEINHTLKDNVIFGEINNYYLVNLVIGGHEILYPKVSNITLKNNKMFIMIKSEYNNDIKASELDINNMDIIANRIKVDEDSPIKCDIEIIIEKGYVVKCQI